MIRMPVHVAYDRRTLVERELDHFVDSKNCLQQDGGRTLHRLEPVCCCERCYACLANPLIDKLSDRDWGDGDQFVAEDDGVALTDPELFSLYPCSSSSCSCECCVDECKKRTKDKRELETMIINDSPPVNKKLMTVNSPAEKGKSFCPKYEAGRRPLVDLQWGAFSDEDDGAKRSSWSHDGRDLSRDETRSWVQPPPNRTICHIVDDVILDRLTSSSPMLTRCCLASRKHGTSRQTGKTKAKNQSISR